ncbi:MAG: DUF2946 domain-containing protein [Azospirillaceae bacterium]|nr:DUF2946 domain-containing protein [Azospirillaceae bacterium]
MRRNNRLHHGVLFCLLALLIQAIVAQLPMPPAGLDMPGMGLHVLCTMAAGDTTPQPQDTRPSKAPLPHAPDCPVCQALTLMASVILPSPPVWVPHQPVHPGPILVAAVRHRVHAPATAHQPRAPPVTV